MPDIDVISKVLSDPDRTRVCEALTAERPGEGFSLDRYYLTEREAAVADRIERQHRAAGVLAQRGIRYCNSCLLYGESGTGKTVFARYMAYRLDLPLCTLDLAALDAARSNSAVRDLAEAFACVAMRPCVLYIAELDAVAAARGDEAASPSAARVTLALKQALDSLPNHVVVIGSTDCVDRLDDRVVRRFTIRHEVQRLTQHERRAYVCRYLDSIGLSLADDQLDRLVSKDVVLARLESNLVDMLVDYIIDTDTGTLS